MFLFLVGIFLIARQRLRSFGWTLLILSGSISLVFSTGSAASLLLRGLEYEYPAIGDLREYEDVSIIVVLTAAGEDEKLWPLSSRVSSASAYRVLEARRLINGCPDCRVYISGGAEATKLMKQLLASTGVSGDSIFEDGKSPHTYDSAVNMEKLIHQERFFLVTSAGHMPRAMAVFRKAGMNPVAAPTDFLLPDDFSRASGMPSPLHLHWSDLAVQEYEALLWYRLTDKI